MIDPHGEEGDVIEDVPELSVDEVERRIGAGGAAAARRRRRAAVQPQGRIRTAPANRRIVLWRDSATILVGVVLALLAARFLLPGDTGIAGVSSPSPAESQITIGSLPTATGFLFSDAPTLPPDVVPSGLHIHATPTPVPVITLPPPTPTPKATATLGPGATPKPTVKPTPKPTVKPSATPATVAAFTHTACPAGGGQVDFDANGSTGGGTLTYDWNFDGGVVIGSPGVTASATFAPGTYTVILTVTGSGGQNSVSHDVTCT